MVTPLAIAPAARFSVPARETSTLGNSSVAPASTVTPSKLKAVVRGEAGRVKVTPLEMTASISATPPLETMMSSPAAPDEITTVPPDLTTVSTAVPPETTTCSPPLETTVLLATPPLSTTSAPPPLTAAETEEP